MRHRRRGPAAAARAHHGAGAQPVGTVPARQREPILDVLRGFALLGILLINIEVLRGADLYRRLGADAGDAEGTAERLVEFALGWLVEAKFLSSFALLFGVGAALMAGRSAHGGSPPRLLLLRRYALLALFGVAHMLLLFPGDILFAYGLAGMALLPFVRVRARTALWWSGGILALVLAVGLGVALLGTAAPDAPGDDPLAGLVEDFAAQRQEHAVAARQDGSIGDLLVANAWESLLVQSQTIALLPWIVALFLAGFAVGRSGVLGDLGAHRRHLRTAMVVGFAVGLPLNVPSGLLRQPMAGGAAGETEVLFLTAQLVGAPVLAVGYLSAVALLCLRFGPPRPLAAVGRMALTGYLLQSLLAVVVFVGLGLYDRVPPLQSMAVVVGIWAVLLVACPRWLRSFRFGPAEWLWRSLTYGRRQPLRAR